MDKTLAEEFEDLIELFQTNILIILRLLSHLKVKTLFQIRYPNIYKMIEIPQKHYMQYHMRRLIQVIKSQEEQGKTYKDRDIEILKLKYDINLLDMMKYLEELLM